MYLNDYLHSKKIQYQVNNKLEKENNMKKSYEASPGSGHVSWRCQI